MQQSVALLNDSDPDTGLAALSSRGPVAYSRRMNVPSDDTALMLRYVEGDLAAFETLYSRHEAPLFRYLLRLSMNQATAEDLFQETWSKIVRARDQYRPTAKFNTYLYRVAHNAFIDNLRRNKRYSDYAAETPEQPTEKSEEPEYQAEKLLAKEKLHKALATLPAAQRDAFLLHEEAGLRLDAIAQVTGENRETIKSRLRYATKKLKAAMADATTKGDPS